jgi:hypothetical protein
MQSPQVPDTSDGEERLTVMHNQEHKDEMAAMIERLTIDDLQRELVATVLDKCLQDKKSAN